MAFSKKNWGYNPRICRKLYSLTDKSKRRGLIEKCKLRRPAAIKHLMAQRDEPACTRASSAVLVSFKRVFWREVL